MAEIGEQVELLGTLKREYGAEWDRMTGEAFADPDFGAVDVEILHGMVRYLKPRRILEIGGGHQSKVIRDALGRNAEDGFLHVALDTLGFGTIAIAGSYDLVVADTSHIRVEGHEVDVLLSWMAKASDVDVYLHDIFLPDPYPHVWSDRGYDEQIHLQAFLNDNPAWELRIAANAVHVADPAAMKATFPSYDPARPIGPGSYWLHGPMKRHAYKANRAPMDSDKQLCIDCGLSVDEGNHTKPRKKA